MRALLALAVLASLLPFAAPAQAFHQSYFTAQGVGIQGTDVIHISISYLPYGGGENLFGTIVVDTQPPLGPQVQVSFPGQISQSGFDNDPIPEMFVRTLSSSDGGATFSVTGGIFQWEQTPLLFVHAYEGHYQGYTIALVGLRVSDNWL